MLGKMLSTIVNGETDEIRNNSDIIKVAVTYEGERRG